MPFPSIIFLIQIYTNPQNVFYFNGKEDEPDFARQKYSSCETEKVSASASSDLKGSVTIEAVICIPLFLYAACTLIWLLEIRSVQITIRSGLHFVGKELAEEAFSPLVLLSGELEREMVNIIGSGRLERSVLVGGANGISCESSYTIPGSGIYELKAEFRVRLPFPYFASVGVECEESLRIKGWNGYVKEIFTGQGMDAIVYVTETGVVYHLDDRCTYLEPSIQGVKGQDITNVRNNSGGKYYECAKCIDKNRTYEMVYITDYGYRYHGKVNCAAIRRKVYAVPISEVKGKVVCSKCGH